MEVLRRSPPGEPPNVAGTPRALNAIYFNTMARDVERWLADEPVSAFREPWPARAGRWARRHSTLVASLGVAAVLLVTTGVGVSWWQERVAQERRFERTRQAEEKQVEQSRIGEQVEALLERSEAAVVAYDAIGARLAVGDAEKQAENPGAERLKERLARCRLTADLLTEMDRIDDLCWDPEQGRVQGIGRAVRELPAAFARLGVVVGRTTPIEAAGIINSLPVRERLLAALDLWLLGASPQDRATLVDLLPAADADPFRGKLRAAAAKSDTDALKALANFDESLRQPA